jgi:hypothetical protein
MLCVVSQDIRVEHARNPVVVGIPFKDRLLVDNRVVKRLQ